MITKAFGDITVTNVVEIDGPMFPPGNLFPDHTPDMIDDNRDVGVGKSGPSPVIYVKRIIDLHFTPPSPYSGLRARSLKIASRIARPR